MTVQHLNIDSNNCFTINNRSGISSLGRNPLIFQMEDGGEEKRRDKPISSPDEFLTRQKKLDFTIFQTF